MPVLMDEEFLAILTQCEWCGSFHPEEDGWSTRASAEGTFYFCTSKCYDDYGKFAWKRSYKPLIDVLKKELPEHTVELTRQAYDPNSIQPYIIIELDGREWQTSFNADMLLGEPKIFGSIAMLHGIDARAEILQGYVTKAQEFIDTDYRHIQISRRVPDE